MRYALTMLGLAACFWLGTAASGRAAAPPAVIDAWNTVDSWLSRSASGNGWRKFLLADDLERQIRAEVAPAPAAIAATVARLRSGAPGLEDARFQALERALTSWLTQTYQSTTPGELSRLVEQATAAFHPVSQQELTWLRTAAQRAMQELGTFLADNPHRDAWEKYLHWEQVQFQLAGDAAPNVELLELVALRTTAGHNAREVPQFVQFRRALDRYLQSLRVDLEDAPRHAYKTRLAQLAGRIQAYRDDPSTANLDAIAETLGELADRGQAPWLVAAVRNHYFHANVYFEAAADLVTYGAGRNVDEVNPVAECIDGSWVRGTGRTIGQVTSVLGHSDQYALLINYFQGQTYSDTLAFNSGATIASRGVTTFQAKKEVAFDGLRFMDMPVDAHAQTLSCIKWVDSGREGPLSCVADRIAWNRVQERKPRSQAAASRSAERRIAQRFGQGVDEALEKSQTNYREKLVFWMLNQSMFPEQINTSSTPQAVQIVARQMQAGQAGAPTSPPPAPAATAMSARIHETAINNIAAALSHEGLLTRTVDAAARRDPRAGRTLKRDELRATIRRQFPDAKLQDIDPNDPPWSITFASREPLRVQFDRNRITITLRIREFGGAGDWPELPEGDLMVEAMYEIKQGPEGAVAELMYEPLVWYGAPGQTKYRQYLGIWLGLGAWDWSTPPNILGALEEVEYQLETREVFPKRIEGLIELGGRWAGYGDLRPESMTAQNGWLTIGWQRAEKKDEKTDQSADAVESDGANRTAGTATSRTGEAEASKR